MSTKPPMDSSKVRVQSHDDNLWRELDKEGVKKEWEVRGLGGRPDPSATIEKESESYSLELTLDRLSHFLGKSKDLRVLEIGCGWGRVFAQVKLREPDLDITGIDLTENLVALANRRMDELDVHKPYLIEAGDAENLRFDDQSFDFAYSCRVFQYLPNPQRGTNEAFRVLKPKGRLVVIMPNKLSPAYFRYHTRLYYAGEVREWFEMAGFTNVRVSSYGFLPFKWMESMQWLRTAAEKIHWVPGIRALGALTLVTGEKP